ncbi:MAG: ACP phosphodiesterase [Mangrovibacterium sp.]
MNVLAHIYLSGDSEDCMLGNFIGDFVKGKDFQYYSPEVQRGIFMHRTIDSFTDSHLLVMEAKSFFRDPYRKYAGVVVDIIFDYFLIKNWSSYSTLTLRNYTQQAHAVLLNRFHLLPQGAKGMLINFIRNKRILRYATLEGIENTLSTMSKFTSLPNYSARAIQIIAEEEEEINTRFLAFFAELQAEVSNFKLTTV